MMELKDLAEKPLEKNTGKASETFLDRLEKSAEAPPSYKERVSEWAKGLEDGTVNLDESNDTKEDSDTKDTDTEDTDTEDIDEAQKDYIEDLKRNSEYPDTIKDDDTPYEKISPEENADKRGEFEDKKEKLIKEWEEKNGREWPRYEKDVYDEKTGNLIRKAGDRYDAHHIHPLTLGGKNEASNITPISAEKHYDQRGVHAPDSPYAKLDNLCKEKRDNDEIKRTA